MLEANPAQLVFEEGEEDGEEEEEESVEDEDEEEDYDEFDDALEPRDGVTSKTRVYRGKSLSSNFRAYLAEHGMEAAVGEQDQESSLDNSLLEASFSEEVRRLLRKPEEELSDSMQVILLLSLSCFSTCLDRGCHHASYSAPLLTSPPHRKSWTVSTLTPSWTPACPAGQVWGAGSVARPARSTSSVRWLRWSRGRR